MPHLRPSRPLALVLWLGLVHAFPSEPARWLRRLMQPPKPEARRKPSSGTRAVHPVNLWSKQECFATFVSTEEYASGVEALYQSLLEVGARAPLVVMKTSNVPDATFEPLLSCANTSNTHLDLALVEVPNIANPYAAQIADGHERFNNVMSKLVMFSELMGCGKVVFLDADTVVLQPIDELFERARVDWIAAGPNNGFKLDPDHFNSGVVATVPSNATFDAMTQQLGKLPSHDKSDQGFLNSFFKHRWTRLGEEFNTLKRRAIYDPDYDAAHVHVLHLVGTKPWQGDAEEDQLYAESHDKWKAFHHRWRARCRPAIK